MKILVVLLIVLQIFGFLYLVNTRPKIEFLPDYPNEPMWSKYKHDPQGFEYPRLRIYHDSFFLTKHKLYFPFISRTEHYWEGRITDMDGFLCNYGWRDDGGPLFDELSGGGTVVEMNFGDIPPMSKGHPKKIKIKKR